MAGDLIDGADALEGCAGCLHAGHCLPIVLLLIGLPMVALWWR